MAKIIPFPSKLWIEECKPFPSRLRIPNCEQRHLHPKLSEYFSNFSSSHILANLTEISGYHFPHIKLNFGFPSALPQEEGRDKGQEFSSPISPAPNCTFCGHSRRDHHIEQPYPCDQCCCSGFEYEPDDIA